MDCFASLAMTSLLATGASRREMVGAICFLKVNHAHHVIASEAKQSILSCCCTMDCFASLAMTVPELRELRNYGITGITVTVHLELR